ncbi:carboxymuconolactone decarboxylase family protein [Mycolicibacterium sp. NCC-Tsukiji]|uniref:carboxymuconolactone decarboxylase family protein n=1 Tax=Mycolicibacterium sp. NCC-Tsukiji TaxID=2185272 RepID=UPI000EEE8B2B|nr:carboxymuconolactone decarboxylase family protein [Mycolicibacterium sp. NCC-Tsukiji]GCA96890.1 hypothetical protein NCCNTM_05250 [Mycolicibacterium sp. NCC-Tsukiji]
MATTPRVIANKQTCRVSRAHHIISRGGKCHRSSGLDHKLVELIKIRVPQINGCPFCLRMHTRDALKLGESTDRIAVLPAWAETGYFSETDRAALGLAESITRVSDGHVSDED